MKIFKFLLLLLLLAVVAAGYGLYVLNQPYQGFAGEKFIDIPKGTSTNTIANLLEANGVVRHDYLFLLARSLSPGAVLQAGEYKFSKPASALQVFSRIAHGDIFYMEVTVPEGQNMFDIAAHVKALGTISEKQFLAAARDASSIRDLDPEAPSLEGYLWPDTYRVVRTTTAQQLCAAMTHKFRATWKTLGTNADIHKTVTLASLVEREARVPGDRPLVASVFHNRLLAGIKLDCDPTTVYAALIEGRYRGKIYRSDLDNASEWNTYQHAGLPPGPIANPGLDALKAALHPADSAYLYFVAKPDGSGAHTFSETLAQHEAATAAYRHAHTANR
jgi:UPF0755 protein